MTRIIPVRPFGKNFNSDGSKDLEETIDASKSSKRVLPQNQSVISFNPIKGNIPRYDFSKISLDFEVGCCYLQNVPFNTIRNNRWEQGCWKRIQFPGIDLPGGNPKSEKFEKWVEWNAGSSGGKDERYCIVPSLPLYFSVWASLYELLGRYPDLVKSYQVDLGVVEREFRRQIFTSSKWVRPFEDQSARIVHGCGLSNHPVGYALSVPEVKDTDTVQKLLFACRDSDQIKSVMSWVLSQEFCISQFEKFGEFPFGFSYQANLPWLFLDGASKSYNACGMFANPKDFKVSP